MNPFLEHLSARVDATASDLKTSLHEHVDSTVDSRVDTFKLELASLVRSGVVECIRTEGRYQHWRVETNYTPASANQHNPPNEAALMSANHSTSFIEGIPPPLLTEFSAAMYPTSQCIADVTFPSGHSISIPLYNVQPTQHQSQHLGTIEQDNISAQSAQTNNNEQIKHLEPFQTDNRVSLLPIASTSATVSDGNPSANSVSLVSSSNVSPACTVQPPNDIKQEHLDDHSDNGQQQTDNDDPDTDAHNVTLDIKTESMDCDFLVVKEEIKEEDEDDHDDECDGCDRCIVKRELVSDDDNSMQLNDSLNAEQVIQSNLEQSISGEHNTANNLEIEENVNQQMTGGNEDQLSQSTQVFQLSDEQANMNEVINSENELVDESEQDLDGDEEMSNSTNDTNHRSVDELNEPSTSARLQSNPIASKPSTSSTHQNATKRKQPPLNRPVKKAKKILEGDDGEDEEDIADEHQEEAKVKVLYLDCTKSECNAKLDSLNNLYDHLGTVHRLAPLQCFAANCNERFDSGRQISTHIKLYHSRSTRFLCSVCHQEYDSQKLTYSHWYRVHLNGQFQCNLVSDCAHVFDTRNKMETHQAKHRSQPKHFCTFNGCSASFVSKVHLKRHESSHLDSKPFHCNWLQCNHRSKQRDHLITHIRMHHFGLSSSVKEQKAKNIVDRRDPNEFVRVVEEVEE